MGGGKEREKKMKPELLADTRPYAILPNSEWAARAKEMGLMDKLNPRYEIVLDPSFDPPGAYLPHQLNVARYMSLLAPRDRLLVFHEMGTGKTRTAICVAERLRIEASADQPSGSFFDQRHTCRGVIVVLKNPTLQQQFRDELVYRATANENLYMPDNAKLLSKHELAARVQKRVAKWYKFATFRSFAKRLGEMSDQQMRQKYAGHLIVVDEVQNIKGVDGGVEDGSAETYKRVYSQLHRCFHGTPNLKVMLLTGTPIKNDVTELADLVNLLLPVDRAWSTELAWWKSHEPPMDELRGIVSHVGASENVVPKIVHGQVYPPKINYTKVTVHWMSHHQSLGYKDAMKTVVDQHSFFIHPRQASLFVFPDGKSGRLGFAKYVVCREEPKLRQGKIVHIAYHALTDELVHAIKPAGTNTSIEDAIANVGKFSCKYAAVLEQLHRTKTGNTFVYITLVNGSGAILFCLLLELVLGMERANGTERTKKPRYMLLSSKTETNRMLAAFNRPQNMHGDYIRVAIGTRAVSEGITLKNILYEHIVSPFWNTGDTSQAIARGWRFNSHLDLLNCVGGSRPTVSVYHHVALDAETGDSIDVHMMSVAESKDRLNSLWEAKLKTVAWENNVYTVLEAHQDGRHDLSPQDIQEADRRSKLHTFSNEPVEDGDDQGMQMSWQFVFDTRRLLFRHSVPLAAMMESIERSLHVKRFARIKKAIAGMKSLRPADPTEDEHRRIVFQELDCMPASLVLDTVQRAIVARLQKTGDAKTVLGLLSFFERDIVWLDGRVLFMDTASHQLYVYKESAGEWSKSSGIDDMTLRSQLRFPASPIVGFIGLYNPFLSEFCLKRVPTTSADDLRLRSTGKKCIDWDMEDLLHIVMSMSDDSFNDGGGGDKRQISPTICARYTAKYGPPSNVPKFEHYAALPRQIVCTTIADWLRKHNLMLEDRNCGHQQKRRSIV